MMYDLIILAAKLVVSLQLYGTCIYKLGTQKHRYLLEDLNAARDIGMYYKKGKYIDNFKVVS